MSPLSVNLVSSALLLLGVVYLLVKYMFGYWKRRGIPQLEPSFPFGNFSTLFHQKDAICNIVASLYNKSKSVPLVGVYISLRPILMVNDVEMAKAVMVRDFQFFHDRGTYVDEDKDPLSGHLFSLSGEKWKNLRTKLTPTFTSGRLKGMFQVLLDCGITLQEHIEKYALKQDTIEIRDLMARYNTNIIASVAFGIDVDTINEPDHIFRVMGRKIFALNFKNALRLLLAFFLPGVNRYLKMKLVDENVEKFMIDVVKDTINYRENNNISRKDFMQLMIQLRNTGAVSIDERWDVESTDHSANKKLSINEAAAQSFLFFAAGFETSSTTMSFCLYELSRNPETQEKLQNEIDDVTKRFDGKITYDSIMEMKYLECCMDETLRKYPPVPFLIRECSQNYTFLGTNTSIEKGTTVILPIFGFQKDPDFYPNPDKFIPERFEDENIKSKPYAPFGDGPRNCIGSRMGKMLTKVGLVTMLSKYTFVIGKDEPELVFAASSLVIATKTGINLKVVKRR